MAGAIRIRDVTLHENSVPLGPNHRVGPRSEPTCRVCIKVTRWSAARSTAIDSMSFTGSPIEQSVSALLCSSRPHSSSLSQGEHCLPWARVLPTIHWRVPFVQATVHASIPWGIGCNASGCEFLVLDLPGSARFFVISSLVKIFLFVGPSLSSARVAFLPHVIPWFLIQSVLWRLWFDRVICLAALKHPVFAMYSTRCECSLCWAWFDFVVSSISFCFSVVFPM